MATTVQRPDDYTAGVPHRLDPALLRELSRLNPLLSSLHIAMEWLFILGAAWLCHRFWHPGLYLLMVAWIGARQHAIAILVHEGAHYRLFANRRLNDWVAEVLLAWPLFGTMRGYAKTHFAHHRHVNSDQDPDWTRKQTPEWHFPQRGRRLAGTLLKDLLGLNTFQVLGRLKAHSTAAAVEKPDRLFTALRLGFYGAIALAISLLGLWPAFLLYWLIPALTWLKLVTRIRSIAEHFALPNDHLYTMTRTTHPSVLDRLFIAPKNIHFHLEHHLYPSVPFFRLPELHRHLMEAPEYRERAHLTRGYRGVLAECVSTR